MNKRHIARAAAFGRVAQIAVFGCGTASAALATLKPLLVGALIDDYGYSARQAGNVVGIEMAGVGIAALLTALAGLREPQRVLLYVGASLGLAGSLVPAMIDSYAAIVLARFVAGFGCGIVASIVLGVIGKSADPDRMFGRYYTFTYLAGALIVPVGAWTLSRFHAAGGYGLLALLLCGVYTAAGRFPDQGGGRTKADTQAARFPLGVAGLSLGASLLFWTGLGAVWAFVERMGVQAGLTPTTISMVLTAGPLASLAGAVTAWQLHIRLGRALPLLGAVWLTMAGAILVGTASAAVPFGAGVLLFSYAWSMFLAYLGGMMSALDPSGRVISASIASQTIGMAIGPVIGGYLVAEAGYRAISILGVSCHLGTLVLLVILMHGPRQTKLTIRDVP